ncbi:MAG TPA: energy transducer TonB [Blastocatellia bacterium]|nr:energy transducer TonB [Blastocatellia bacterium]
MLLLCFTDIPPVGVLEKMALDAVQRMPVSKLDAELPPSSFANWFNQLIGPEAGVVWQLTECGERQDRRTGASQDLIACMEADAILSDGRKVVVAISVGTFKKGISGEPAFHSAVIEQDNQLYEIARLRDLPDFLRSPRTAPVRLPEVSASLSSVSLPLESVAASIVNVALYPEPEAETMIEPEARPVESIFPATPLLASVAAPLAAAPVAAPPAEPVPQQMQKVQEGILQGRAMIKAMPIYPANARSLNARGAVMVQVVVSEQGRVVEARAISGHPVLRGPAVEAARKWVFKPTTLNGLPVKVESVLTFVFNL